jgi:lysozyme family protein
MPDLASLRAQNAARWQNAKLTRASEFGTVAARLAAPSAKARYQAIEAKTGVPWFFVAVAHQRESSQDWSRSLAQGDPWNKKSTHVPKGRGPFASFEDAAVDALTNCAPYAARNKDWRIGGLLTMLEQYNGLGYFNRGLPSPYVWSGTDQYVKGKYIADGKFDPNVVDKQLGCAGLILAMVQIDPSIEFEVVEKSAVLISKPPAAPAAPSPTNPAKGSIGALIAGFVSSIFKRAA